MEGSVKTDMKVKKFYESIYHTHLTLLWDCKAFDAEDYLRRSKIGKRANLVKCSGQTGSYIFKKPEYEQERYYIYIEKGKENNGTLIHEIAHLVFMALADCGIGVDQTTDEIYAYYLEHWYTKIAKELGV